MRGFIRCTVWTIIILLPAGLLGQDRGSSAKLDAMRPDEAAVRANVNAFVRAYNAHDAKLIAALFMSEAQMIDEDGRTTVGRDEITKVFSTLFADAPKSRIEVNVESVRFIGTNLAVETGVTKVMRQPGESPEINRYTVVHVKTRGGWLMALARDTEGTQPSNFERLKPLEWLLGEWIDESHESVVLISSKWSDNKNFILQTIKVRMQGRDAMDVTQRIGWDPMTKRIKSWAFDSEGGYGESIWVRDGDHWLVKAHGVHRDGLTSSATNTFTPTSKHSYTWRSTDRVVGNDVAPPVEVKVVRKAPQPVGLR
jgi:uncharacterized protein (TIGR02246 family)